MNPPNNHGRQARILEDRQRGRQGRREAVQAAAQVAQRQVQPGWTGWVRELFRSPAPPAPPAAALADIFEVSGPGPVAGAAAGPSTVEISPVAAPAFPSLDDLDEEAPVAPVATHQAAPVPPPMAPVQAAPVTPPAMAQVHQAPATVHVDALMPVPEDDVVRAHRRELVTNVFQNRTHAHQVKAHEIVNELTQGYKTGDQLMTALGFGAVHPIQVMMEAGIIIKEDDAGLYKLTKDYWFAAPEPLQAGEPKFPFQKLNPKAYSKLRNSGQIEERVVPVPQDEAALTRQDRVVNHIATHGDSCGHARRIVDMLKNDPLVPKTEKVIKEALGYINPGTHGMRNPIKELKDAGIIVAHARVYKLTPFFWFGQ